MEIKESLAVDDQSKANPKSKKTAINQPVSLLIPYIVIAVGCILTLLIWHDLLAMYPSERFFYTPSAESLPWLALALGILFSILCAAGIRLIQLSRRHRNLLEHLKEEFNQEIAQHIQVEETKKKLEIALVEGQKLQAIGTLAGGIAHDFNNILYAINGYVEMARDDIDKESITYKNLGRVLEASHRGQELVARILAFGRQNQRHEQTPIALNIMMGNVLALLRPTIPSSVRIHLINSENNYTILGNQTQLHQVIVNIINNAVDAMYGEGNVTITIYALSADDPYLKQFPKIAVQNYYRIDITDTGHGMDQTTLKRIFEPFFTTKEVGKGTGLGLATVHGIISQHHGEVLVTSQLGVGTTFTLILPEYQAQTNTKETAHGDYSFSGR